MEMTLFPLPPLIGARLYGRYAGHYENIVPVAKHDAKADLTGIAVRVTS